MDIVVLGFAFLILGVVVFLFGIVQILLICFVSFPLTNFYAKHNLLINPGHVIKREILTILLWLFIDGTISFFVFVYASNISIGAYVIGISYMFLIGLKRYKINEDNTRDFLRVNRNNLDWTVEDKSLSLTTAGYMYLKGKRETTYCKTDPAYETVFRIPNDYMKKEVVFSGTVSDVFPIENNLSESSEMFSVENKTSEYYVVVFQDNDHHKRWLIKYSTLSGSPEIHDDDYVKVAASITDIKTSKENNILSHLIVGSSEKINVEKKRPYRSPVKEG